jgi:hypothetical protein
MINVEGSAPNLTTAKSAILYLAAGIFAIILGCSAIIVTVPKPAAATPAYTAQTGLPCGRCHVKPAGGLPLTDFGKAFAANGHKVPKQ